MTASDDPRFTRRELASAAAVLGAGMALAGAPSQGAGGDARTRPKPGQRSVFGLKHPPMKQVRVGMIGVGARGSSLLGNLLDIEDVQITALCDIVPGRVAKACGRVRAKGQPEPARFTKGETDFENLCRSDDVDLVYVVTPWEWHVPMAVSAMRSGKHAAVEVPAAITLDGCWQLVDTAEQTQRHCMMLENCCYGETELLLLNLVRQGLFGELTHGEAGYLHGPGDAWLGQRDGIVWRRRHLMKANGNLYPTHGLGPMALYMGIHGGDRFDRLVSMSSIERSLSGLRDTLPAGDPRRKETYACGDVNTTLIQTALGRSIMVQFDIVTPRPYSRINAICGTGGAFRDYPPRIHLRGKQHGWETDLAPYHQKHGHPLWKRHKARAVKSGGHGGMDYLMNWRLIHCLRQGLPLDMTVYDGAAWSSVFPLSIESVLKSNAPVAFPDFTRGEWKTQKNRLEALDA